MVVEAFDGDIAVLPVREPHLPESAGAFSVDAVHKLKLAVINVPHARQALQLKVGVGQQLLVYLLR